LPGCAPGRALTFFASPKKVSKERRAGFVVPALRSGHAALLGQCGKCRNSPCGLRHLHFFLRPGLRYSPPLTTTGDRRPKPKTTRTRHGASLWGSAVGFSAVRFPCRVAGLSSAAAGGSGRALSERSEFSPTLPGASSARYPAAALTSARLLFAYFLLAKQEKVSRPPGRDPACHANKPNPRKSKSPHQAGSA